MKTKKELHELAEKYIKATNVHCIVYAKEGGVIELTEFLIDFIKFIEANSSAENNIKDENEKS